MKKWRWRWNLCKRPLRGLVWRVQVACDLALWAVGIMLLLPGEPNTPPTTSHGTGYLFFLCFSVSFKWWPRK